MNFKEAIINYEPSSEQEASDKQVMLDHILVYGDSVLTREQQVAHFTSSSIILNEEMSHMLMIHHNIYQTWTWTGGHMDGATDFLEVALSEAKEETGLSTLKPLSEHILSLDILPVWGHVKRGHYVSAHLHMNAAFVFIASDKAAIGIKPDENSAIAWIPLNDVNTHSNEPDIIAVYDKLLTKAKCLVASY